MLQAQLSASFLGADHTRPQDVRLEPAQGVYLEVELRRNEKADALERKRDGVKFGAVKMAEEDKKTIALFVPCLSGLLPIT